MRSENTIVLSDALSFLPSIETGSVQLVLIDPPFNTGNTQSNISAVKHKKIEKMAYSDSFENYIEYLKPYLCEAFRVLSDDGTLCVHLDWHEVHYVKVELDKIFGRQNFLNNVVWSYDWGGRARDRWAHKHDDILIYAKDVDKHIFNFELIDRIPYMLATSGENSRFVTPEKAARGKALTDVWWNSIVGTNSRERTGYPTQKPQVIYERLIKMHSSTGSHVLDFFAGSGTSGAAAFKVGRTFTMIDSSEHAINVMKKRYDSLNIAYNVVKSDI